MIILSLALARAARMTDAEYDCIARERDRTRQSTQAQEVVTEAISREDYGASVILHANGTKRGVCIIESEQRMTCVRSTQMAPTHFHFDPPSVNRGDAGHRGHRRGRDATWVGLAAAGVAYEPTRMPCTRKTWQPGTLGLPRPPQSLTARPGKSQRGFTNSAAQAYSPPRNPESLRMSRSTIRPWRHVAVQ